MRVGKRNYDGTAVRILREDTGGEERAVGVGDEAEIRCGMKGEEGEEGEEGEKGRS